MPLSHRDYTVACICPMGGELAPVKALLDQQAMQVKKRTSRNFDVGISIFHLSKI
jgi:hypothetical protein